MRGRTMAWAQRKEEKKGDSSVLPIERSSQSAPGPLWRALALGAVAGQQGTTPAQRSMAEMRASQGESLAAGDMDRFSSAFGLPLDRVRIHRDDAADRAARAVQARAVTTGRDVYFGRGWYRPGTLDGDRLLAHELTHVVQDVGAPPVSGPVHLSQPDDPAEAAARNAEGWPAQSPRPGALLPEIAPAVSGTGRILHRQPEAVAAEYLLLELMKERAAREVVELQGRLRFELDPSLRFLLRELRDSIEVNVQFGSLGRGVLRVWTDDDGRFQSDFAVLPLSIPRLGHDDPSAEPALLAYVVDDEVRGIFGGATDGEIAGDPMRLATAILAEGAARLVEWRGIQNADLRGSPGQLLSGHLILPPRQFAFDLNGVFHGTATLALHDAEVSFAGDARLQVPGLDEATLHLVLDPSGGLSGTARMRLQRAGFDGSLLASFGRGILDIRGDVRYVREDFEGSLTVLVTDAASAWAAVNGELTQWNAAALGGAAGEGTAAVQGADRPGDLAIAGWGVVDFRYKDWLHGRAQVIVDPAGDITSLGRIHLPREIQILGQKKFAKQLVDKIGGHVHLLSIWDVVGVSIGADGSVDAVGEVGPVMLTDLHAAGAFSTRHGFPNTIVIGGRIELPAALTVTITLTGYVSVEAQVPILGEASDRFQYKILETSLTLQGSGDIEGFASAAAAIHRTQSGGDARYWLTGTLEASGAATVMFSGQLNVKVPALGVKKHLLEFGGRRYVLGRVQGSAHFRRFEIGSEEEPELKAKHSAINVHRLLNDIAVASGVPDRPGADDAAATWTPGGGPGDVVAEAAEPTPPVFPANPQFGAPTLPPRAPSADQMPTAPAADAGASPPTTPAPIDAGVLPGGTGPAPEPAEAQPPTAPAETHRGERNAPFDMEGVPHQLTITPGEPPIVLMESERGRLVLKLMRKRDQVDTFGRARMFPDPALQPQLDVLAELIAEAEQVEAQAEQLGYGDRFGGDVPGLGALAEHIHAAAHQFGWSDFVIDLPTESVPTPVETQTEAGGLPLPAPSPEVLGLPFDKFLSQVDAMQNAEALPYLREQRRYFEAEVLQINDYLSVMRARGRSEAVQPQERRRSELIGRIRTLDIRIRRAEDELQPEPRFRLPCFAPETIVLTPSGPRPIGALQIGDTTWSYDVAAGRVVPGHVAAVHRNLTLRFVAVTAAGETVRATGRHPFWIEEAGDWVAAMELKQGMHVRTHSGGTAPIERVDVEAVTDAPTVDLSIVPCPTYFVGAGLLVHNAPPTRHFAWRDASGASVPSGDFKIYLGTNSTSTEWADCMYVGQTKQSRAKRELDHRAEAQGYLDAHPDVPDDDPLKRHWRFKLHMDLTVIADGLLNKDQASWLEQQNIDLERSLRTNWHNLMNRREELVSTGPAVEARIRADPIVRATGYCP